MTGDVILPPVDHIDQPVGDIAVHRAAGQQMLGAVDFGCLGEHPGAAMAHQQIDGGAQGRVRRDPRIGVGTAAFEAQDQFAGGHGLAPGAVDFGQHLVDPRAGRLDGGLGAAGILDGHGMRRGAQAGPLGIDEMPHLGDLAAETDEQHAAEVGMPRIARQAALEHLHAGAAAGHAAARAVGDRHHAVDMGIGGQRVAAITIRHVTRHRG